MNREQLKALEKETLEKLARIRASMAFLDRRNVRKGIALIAFCVMVVAGVIYKLVN